jgi:hypothetical protein
MNNDTLTTSGGHPSIVPQALPAPGDSSSSSINPMGLDEVRHLVKSLSIDASDEEIELIFRECDADGGGSIDDTEFSELVKRLQTKAGKSIAGRIRWRKAIRFVSRFLQNEKQKVRLDLDLSLLPLHISSFVLPESIQNSQTH